MICFSIINDLRVRAYPTQRAPDGWESARFQAVFVA